MIPLRSGGAYRRPGTLFETSLAASTDLAPRIIPFVYSRTEAYAMVLGKVSAGSGYVYPYRTTSNTIASTAGTCTGTIPYAAGSYSVTTYRDAIDEVHDVQYTQSADVLYLVHPNYKPYRIVRSAQDTFTVNNWENWLSGGTGYRDGRPYKPQNTTSTTLTPSHTSGTGRTLTASSGIFTPSHVGVVYKIDDGAQYACVLVTGYTNSTTVTIDIKADFNTTGSYTAWWEASWSDLRGWPRAIGFYQKRLVYAGNATEPDTLWFSQSDNYDTMSVQSITDPRSSPTGSQPFQITMSSQQLNQIQWISADKTLAVGTLGDEFIIEPEEAGSFGCDNAKVTAQSHYGSSYHQAVRLNDELIFCLQNEREVRSLVFNEFENTFSAEPVQVLFDQYPKRNAVGSVSGRNGYRTFQWDGSRSTLWCVDLAGNWFGMTRDRKLGLSMWHTHKPGGYDATETETLSLTKTDPAYSICSGSVISLAVIPNPLIGMNDVWLVVKRKINGTFRWHIERMIGEYYPFESVYSTYFSHQDGCYNVDAAVYSAGDYPGSEDGVFSGLSHLEGKSPVGTVTNSRGMVSVNFGAVSSGSATLSSPHWPNWDGEIPNVAIGLGYTSIVKPVRIEAGSQIGTAQGAKKRIHELTVRFFKTLAAKIGRDSSTLETVVFREGSTPMGYSAELFTGDKVLKFNGDYDRDGYVYIIQDKPLPFAVMAIVAEGQVYD